MSLKNYRSESKNHDVQRKSNWLGRNQRSRVRSCIASRDTKKPERPILFAKFFSFTFFFSATYVTIIIHLVIRAILPGSATFDDQVRMTSRIASRNWSYSHYTSLKLCITYCFQGGAHRSDGLSSIFCEFTVYLIYKAKIRVYGLFQDYG